MTTLIAEAPDPTPCPKCNAAPDTRIESAGFGNHAHEVCGRCGFDFAMVKVEKGAR